MEAKELRIGNFVNLEGEIINIDLDYFYWEIEGNGLLHLTEPIPLTEEWLLKFGAEKVTYDDGSGYYLALRHKDFSVFYEEGWGVYLDIYEVIIKLEYVHKLQNIWYALTNEELKINDK